LIGSVYVAPVGNATVNLLVQWYINLFAIPSVLESSLKHSHRHSQGKSVTDDGVADQLQSVV